MFLLKLEVSILSKEENETNNMLRTNFFAKCLIVLLN